MLEHQFEIRCTKFDCNTNINICINIHIYSPNGSARVAQLDNAPDTQAIGLGSSLVRTIYLEVTLYNYVYIHLFIFIYH